MFAAVAGSLTNVDYLAHAMSLWLMFRQNYPDIPGFMHTTMFATNEGANKQQLFSTIISHYMVVLSVVVVVAASSCLLSSSSTAS